MENCIECDHALGPGDAQCPACGTAVAAVEPTMVRGSTILDGKWAIDHELGRGGMGTVLLAKDLELERLVAIKMLSPALKEEPEVIARFEREAKMLARLEHPNIVPIYAVGRSDGLPFIVMKNLEGYTLTGYLAEGGRLTPEQMLPIARQLCAGLGFLHSKGIIHRDIKPGNIFVGPDGHVTILDLGVAHDRNQNMTRSGLLIGTPRYMSPEQILKGTGGLDHRSDIYALGTVLFEMLTGAPVFDAESDFGVMRAHTDQAPPDLADFAPEIAPAVTQVLHRALAKNRDERFQSAQELYDALETAVLGLSSPRPNTVSGGTRPPVSRSQVGGAAGRPRTPASPSAAGRPKTPAISMTVPPTVTPSRPKTVPPRVAPQPPTPEAPRHDTPKELAAAGIGNKRSPAVIAAIAVLVVAVLGAGAFFALRDTGGPKPLPIAAMPNSPATPIEVKPDPPAPAPTPVIEVPPKIAEAEPAVAPEKPVEAAPEKPVEPARERVRKTSRSPDAESEVRVLTTFEGKNSWAWLDVNGLRRGTTPAVLKLAPGSYKLRLTRPGYKTIEQSLEVQPGKAVRLALELQQ